MPRSNLAINWNSRKNPLLRLLSKHLLNQLSITLVHSFHFFLFFNFYCTLFTWNQIINGIATIMIMWKNVSWNQLMLLSFVHKTNVSSSYCYLFSFFFYISYVKSIHRWNCIDNVENILRDHFWIWWNIRGEVWFHRIFDKEFIHLLVSCIRVLIILPYFLNFSIFSRREIDHFSRFSTRNSKPEKCASLNLIVSLKNSFFKTKRQPRAGNYSTMQHRVQ